MRTIAVTKASFKEGTAYQGWVEDKGLGRVGGSYAELLCDACEESDPISLVSLVDQQPVGQINLLKGALILKGERVPIYWGSGLVVPEEHRTTGAGLALLMRMRGLAPGTGVVSISQMALPLYVKLGWHCLGAQRHLLLTRPSTLINHRLGMNLPARLLGRLANLVALVHRKIAGLLLALISPGFQTDVIHDPADIREDWFSNHTDRPYSTERSAMWLRRVVSQGPNDNARRLFAVRDSNHRVLGYFITAVAQRTGVGQGRFGDLMVASLRDWVSFDQARLPDHAVMLMGLRALLSADCDVVELCIPNGQASRLPTWLGMVKMGELQFALRLSPDLAKSHPDLSNPQLWWFRPGDGDAFLL